MFKNHPKGLIAASLANMGERFGFYIMMAILTLFISAKFGLSEQTTGYVYSAFYASIYLLALVGGVIEAVAATVRAGRGALVLFPTSRGMETAATRLEQCLGQGSVARLNSDLSRAVR